MRLVIPKKFLTGRAFFGFCFLFAALVSAFIQLVLLPHIVPSMHLGGGLLAGADGRIFHPEAVLAAERIRTHGWSEWTLLLNTHGPSGIASALYALFTPKLWVLIPLNAALHATAGLLLFRIILLFGVSVPVAMISTLPLVMFPSSALWYAQIHKDSYVVTGFLAFLFGWCLLLTRAPSVKSGRKIWELGIAPLSIALGGIALIYIGRAYLLEVLLVSSVPVVLMVGATLAREPKKAALKYRASFFLIFVAIIWAALITVSRQDHMETRTEKSTGIVWSESKILPHFIDERFHAVAFLRHHSLSRSLTAGSNIDADTQFESSADVLSFIPRAAQIAFLSPFPSSWVNGFKSERSIGKRFFSLGAMVETLILYTALAGLYFAFRFWRKNTLFWVILSFTTIPLLLYGLTVINLGSIYRVRYVFIMTLGGLGVAALFRNFLQKFSRNSAH